jgi:hypothetical protein
MLNEKFTNCWESATIYCVNVTITLPPGNKAAATINEIRIIRNNDPLPGSRVG